MAIKLSPVNSMTGFTRYTHKDPTGAYVWEIRTLNHRFSDISIIIPPFIRSLELRIREVICSKIARGKIDAHLKYIANNEQFTEILVNEQVVKSLNNAFISVKKSFFDIAPANFGTILDYPGVIVENNEQYKDLEDSVIKSLALALVGLVESRNTEGNKLTQFLQGKISILFDMINELKSYEKKIIDVHKDDIKKKVSEFGVVINEGRLEQELALLAVKTDIVEEIFRFETHVNEFKVTLSEGGTIGRKLDFILQEMLREINTIGSKINILSISKLTIEIKVIIEQMREQVQNIE